MINIFKKKFNRKDIKNYINLTGDRNILHYDKDINLFSPFQKPIVFGALIIETLLKKINTKNLQFEIEAYFKKPIFINELIFFNKIAQSSNKISFKISNNFEDKVFLNINFIHKNSSKFLGSFLKELRFIGKEVGNFKKNLNLITNINIKNSNASKIKIHLKKKLSENLYHYNKINKNFISQINFISFSKNIKFRLRYKNQLIKKIPTLGKTKILIIGRNSGLGKILAHFFCKRKIKFSSTYFNKKNFNKLKGENIVRLNIEKPTKKTLKFISKFNVIYYFPSPKIFSYNDVLFSYKKFNKFNSININSVEKILSFLAKESSKKFKFFLPSTTLVNRSNDNLEYSISKLCQERLIKILKKKYINLKILNPRFDAIYTDSTKSLIISEKDYTNFINKSIKNI